MLLALPPAFAYLPAQVLAQVLAQSPAVQRDRIDALHRAVLKADLRSTRDMLTAGADPNARNEYQVTPLSIACLTVNPSSIAA